MVTFGKENESGWIQKRWGTDWLMVETRSFATSTFKLLPIKDSGVSNKVLIRLWDTEHNRKFYVGTDQNVDKIFEVVRA